MPTARRTRRVKQSMFWAAVMAALVVHGTVLGTVHALGLSMISEGFTRGSPSSKLVMEEAELKTTCAGDVVLATSGRTALCLAPWVGDVDQCLADAQMSLWMDLSSCQARNDPNTAIAMIESKAADRLTPIDPERLLDEVKPPDKKPPAPQPVPQIAQAQPQPPPPPPPPPAPARPQQIIETVKPNDEKEPENARFLSEYNTKVEKEKVSRGARNEPMVAKAKPEELTPKTKPKDEPSVKQQEPDRVPGKNEHAPDVPGHLSMRNPGAQSPAETEQEAKVRGSTTGAAGAMADGYVPRKGASAVEQQRHERAEIPRGQGGAGGGAPQVPNLKPTEDVLERALGGGSVDHLEDVENGDETALSAKRWVYASFFNRLKRQVAQNWDPVSVWRRRDPTGTVYGFKTRVTEVRVSLSRKGELAKILVTTPSGVVELDDEAVRAFKSAGPFPNPPDGLIQKDNLITFAFSFFFEIGSPHVQWRMPTSM
jgi:TonB family protein